MIFLAVTKELSSSQRVQNSDFLNGLCSSLLAMYPAGTPVLPWAGYLAEESGEFVGSCAFKSPPVQSEVEIAYFTFPGYEEKGIATRMAQWLIERAVENGVERIKAQTLPEVNASTRILEKLGFSFVGPANYLEDGEVWEWVLTHS